MVVGHQKGKTSRSGNACYFGFAHPEGYRKAMAKMRLAAKFHMPVICLIDTAAPTRASAPKNGARPR